VSDVLVEDGDHVVQGAVLARVESVQQEQALRAAEAGLSTAQADYRQAVENLQRQDALLRRGATTRTGRDSAEDALHIAEGALTQAGAELDRAQKALADTVLLAPMDATVIDRKIEPGQVVGAAQSVMDLALGPDMDAIFEVPEAVLVNNETRSGIDLVLIEYPEQHFTGQAREVSPLVDEKTGTVEATVSVINPPPAISYGDAVRATVQIQGPPRVALPYTAMSALAEGPAVWVVDPATMKVSLQPIVIDRFDTGRILVASGLADGTLVVGRGAQLLYPGRTVRQAGGAE
jgi:RND family efflux transporter MFP subunit